MQFVTVVFFAWIIVKLINFIKNYLSTELFKLKKKIVGIVADIDQLFVFRIAT